MSLITRNQINPEYIKMRWQEPYVSGGLNRKLFGILPSGIYHGFKVDPGPASRQITLTTEDPFGQSGNVSGYSEGNFDPADGYSIAAFSSRQGVNTTVAIQEGVSGSMVFDCTGYDDQQLILALRSRYYEGRWTDASVDLVTADEIEASPSYLVICTINVPSSGTDIDETHIVYDDATYPRTEPFASLQKWGYMKPEYVRKLLAHEQMNFHKLTGGGTISYADAGDTVTWDSQIRIYVPGRTDELYVDAGDSTFPSNGYMAYVRVPHDSPSGGLPVEMDLVENIDTENVSGVAIPLFLKALNFVYAGAGSLNLEPGEEAADGIDSNLPGDLRNLLGVGDTATEWGFTNNFPGDQFQDAVERWSSLSEDDENLHEDRNIVLGCSGTVSYSGGVLEWSDPFTLHVPNESFDFTVTPDSVTGISDGDAVYVTVDRSGVSTELTAIKASNGALPLDKDNKNHFLIGYREGSKFLFRNGYVWEDGQSSSFENTVRVDPNLQWDATMSRLIATDEIAYHQGVSANIEWTGYLYLRSMAGELFYAIAPDTIALEDGEVAYSIIERDIEITPKLIWTNGSKVVSSVASESWTSSVSVGDFIKVKAQGYSSYQQIDTIDSSSQVTLVNTYLGDTSSVTGDRSQYAIKDLIVNVTERELVPESGYWLMLRDDLAAAKGRVQIRHIGELGEGEKITPTNWVYEETQLSTTDYFLDDELTLPVDSRNSNVEKYYRSGSGDLEFYINGVYQLRDKTQVTSMFGLVSYEGVTGGFVYVNDSVDLSIVRREDFFVDALGNEFQILGKVSNELGNKKFYIGTGHSVDNGFGAYVYRQGWEETGSDGDLVRKIVTRQFIPTNALLTWRIQPINRPYSDGSGSGPTGGGGGGGVSGTVSLQGAYDEGNVISTVLGRPFIVTGPSGKIARFIGDIEVTGVIDPKGMTFTRESANPAPGQDCLWTRPDGTVMFTPSGGSDNSLLEQDKNKKLYENNTISTLSKGRVVTKDGVGNIKYGDYTTLENSLVIGVLTQDLGPSAQGYVQRSGWVESSFFNTTSFTEGSLPSDGEMIWLSSADGKMTGTGPVKGSGFRGVVVGIWDDGGLLWQVRDFGIM